MKTQQKGDVKDMKIQLTKSEIVKIQIALMHYQGFILTSGKEFKNLNELNSLVNYYNDLCNKLEAIKKKALK